MKNTLRPPQRTRRVSLLFSGNSTIEILVLTVSCYHHRLHAQPLGEKRGWLYQHVLYFLCQSSKDNDSGSCRRGDPSTTRNLPMGSRSFRVVYRTCAEESVWRESRGWGKTGHTSKVNKLLGGQQGPYKKISSLLGRRERKFAMTQSRNSEELRGGARCSFYKHMGHVQTGMTDAARVKNSLASTPCTCRLLIVAANLGLYVKENLDCIPFIHLQP